VTLSFRRSGGFVIFPREMSIRLSIRLLLALVVTSALVVASGCATVQPPRSQRATKSNPYDFHKEGAVPAEKPEVKDEVDVEEMPVAEESLDVEEADIPPDTVSHADATPPGATRGMVDGFRVQVFAGQTQDVAEAARRTAQARLGMPAYVEFVDGLYKVRVGDCLTREDAESVLATCKAVFYKDAWIVESKVLAPAGSRN